MAFTLLASDPLTGHPRYNIDYPIAERGYKDDVMLLQVLLNIWYFDLADVSHPLGFVPPAKVRGRLVEDGKMGDQTGELSIHCYGEFVKQGADLTALWTPGGDQIDPMRQRGERSTLTHKHYFMDFLNEACSRGDVEKNLGRYAFLRWDPSVPELLRNALMRTRATAYQYGGTDLELD